MAQGADTSAVVRTQRLEIVDDRGRVRAALATDRDDLEGAVVGLELFSEGGEARAWLMEVGGVVQLALALHGDQVAILECVPDASGSATTSLVLCDRSGRPVARWAVEPDGSYSASEGRHDPG